MTNVFRLKMVFLMLAIIAIGFQSNISWAQCSSADAFCNQPRIKREKFADDTLEAPPTLDAVDPAELKSLWATDLQEEYLGKQITSGSRTFGAVAKDFAIKGLQGIGVSANALSEEEAHVVALNLCYRNGGQDCQVNIVYSNECLGMALDAKEESYWKRGITKEIAAQAVMQHCSETSGSFCKLVFAECSYPTL